MSKAGFMLGGTEELVATGETLMLILAGMDRESAEQWNATHPKGTRVSVSLRSEEALSAATATSQPRSSGENSRW